jgi:hypothetical protein
MRGKPFAAAIVAFLLVFLGGAAIAGVGTPSATDVAAPVAQGDEAPDKSTTTTTHGEKPRDEQPKEEPKDERDGDDTPPRFEIRSPENNSHVDERVIVVSGGVEPGAKVFLGDRRAHVEGDDWKIEVELEKGKNSFRFKAFDEAGNYTIRGLTVWLGEEDDTPPRFEITSPRNGHETDDKVILVKGGVEPGAKVYFGDRQAHVDGDDWKMEVELRNGKNELTFKAIDEAGNKTYRSITVYYVGDGDTTPPRFTITSPDNGHETDDKVILVKGGVEPGSRVYHEGRWAHVEGDDWAMEVELRNGKNELTFKAIDEAGNKTYRSITVWYVGDGDVTPPHFTITSHANESETDDKVILVKGGVEPGAKVYLGERRANVEGDDWSIEVELEKGKNILTFKAYDEAGNKTARTLYIWYVGEGEPDYEFWAAQKYGSCGEEVPYDVFYGEGKPGSVIEIGSAYGNGRVEVGENGHWEVKVYFEGSPVGEPFKVTVYASTGETKYFTFVNTGGEGDH